MCCEDIQHSEQMFAGSNDPTPTTAVVVCCLKIRRPRRVLPTAPVGPDQHQPIVDGYVLYGRRPRKTRFATYGGDPHAGRAIEVENTNSPSTHEPE